MFISLAFINKTKGRQSRADMVASGFLGLRLLYSYALPSKGIDSRSMMAGQPPKFRSVFQFGGGGRGQRKKKTKATHSPKE